jgi:DNA-binding Lrp family transcriptional regulator
VDESVLNVVRAARNGLELVSRPFDAAAESCGMDAGEFLELLGRMTSAGILRRAGASFNHYRAGWTSNSLCAANLSGVSPSGAANAAREVSRRPWASHCYLRRAFDRDIRVVWPYNLYVMIHAGSDGSLAERENALRGELEGFDFVSLRTVAEYKKTYFKMDWGTPVC